MQRVGTLIDKLQEHYREDRDVNALLLTAQMLVNELSTHIASANEAQPGTHASVLLPRAVKVEVPLHAMDEATTPPVEAPQVFELEVEPQPEIEEIAIDETEEPLAAAEEERMEMSVAEVQESPQEVLPVEQPAEAKTVTAIDMDFFNGQQWLFDMQTEVPTLAQFKPTEENPEAESLNDKLKVERKELGSVLKESPIKDLKKAIGINDRYQFINELFRGDENMFERSLKTINSFNVYSEAEYWIKRELKLKLGWNEESEIVMHFDQLVKRRFL